MFVEYNKLGSDTSLVTSESLLTDRIVYNIYEHARMEKFMIHIIVIKNDYIQTHEYRPNSGIKRVQRNNVKKMEMDWTCLEKRSVRPH